MPKIKYIPQTAADSTFSAVRQTSVMSYQPAISVAASTSATPWPESPLMPMVFSSNYRNDEQNVYASLKSRSPKAPSRLASLAAAPSHASHKPPVLKR